MALWLRIDLLGKFGVDAEVRGLTLKTARMTSQSSSEVFHFLSIVS